MTDTLLMAAFIATIVLYVALLILRARRPRREGWLHHHDERDWKEPNYRPDPEPEKP